MGPKHFSSFRTARVAALAAIATIAPAALTACGSSDADAAGGTTSITVGAGDNILDLPMQVAQANGYFSAQGLQVKFVSTTASTGPAALQSGSVQFLNSSPTGFLSALAKKIPETAISVDGLGNPLAIVVSKKFATAKGLTAQTPSTTVATALSGSTGGTSSANTKAEAGLFLKTRGVDATVVKWVTLPSPAANKAALISGQIDWFITSNPTPLAIQQSGDGVVVADSTTAPEWSPEKSGYGELVVARTDYVKDHPDIARKFVAAVAQATAYMNTHVADPALLAVATKVMTGTPGPALQASLKQVGWPASGAMNDAGWQTTLAFVNQLGTLPAGTKITSDNWTSEYAQ